MASVGVVSDSTADFATGVVEQYRIGVVPLIVNWDGQTYRDKIDLSTTEFYARLRTSKSLPTTGAPSLSSFEDAFRKQLDSHEEVVAVMLAAKLSATYSVACQAAEGVAAERIRVVDSGSVSIGLGWLAELAATLAASGRSAEQIVAEVENARSRVRIFAALDTLSYLQKGGRVGRAQAIAGNILNFKPIISVRDGEVHPVERPRTMGVAMRRLAELAVSQGAAERIAVVHAGAPDLAGEFERLLQSHYPGRTIERGELTPVVGTHGGPGLVGVGLLLAP